MAKRDDDVSRYWVEQFRTLGEQLKMRVEPLQIETPVAA